MRARTFASTEATDWQRIAAAAAGDEDARTDFSTRYRPLVQLWLWLRWNHTRLRNSIEDAAQEVLMACLRPGGALCHVDRARAPHGFQAFLRGIVRNVAGRFERSEAKEWQHRQRLGVGAAQVTSERLGAAAQLDREWLDGKVHAVLATLERELDRRPPHRSLRELLQLHFDEGLSVRAIAQRWAVPAEHVHELRRRACRRFRSELLHAVHRDHAAPKDARDAGRELLDMLDA